VKLTPLVNFINILRVNFLYESIFGSFFCLHVKASKTTFVQKIAFTMLMKLTPVVNFINILRTAFAPIFFCQKTTEPIYNYKKAVYEKWEHKMWVKMTPAVNFIYVLHVWFLYKIFGAKISNPKASFVVFSAKFVQKMRAKNVDEINTWCLWLWGR